MIMNTQPQHWLPSYPPYHSPAGWEFEKELAKKEMINLLSWSRLQKEYYDWQWECDFRLSVDDTKNYLRACKEMTRVEKLMWGFKGVNILNG